MGGCLSGEIGNDRLGTRVSVVLEGDGAGKVDENTLFQVVEPSNRDRQFERAIPENKVSKWSLTFDFPFQ